MSDGRQDMGKRRSVRRYGSRRYKKPFSEQCKDFLRNFVAFMFSNVGIIGLVVGYTVAGAFIFQAIEGHVQPDIPANMTEIRNNMAEKLWELVSENNVFNERTWRNSVTTELETFTIIVTQAVRDGYDGSENKDYSEKWAFPGAFLYSLTVITTIGYGNVSPKTAWGKIVTIVYAIIGMPLFLLYLSNIGDILARCFKWLYSRCCLCQWCPGVARRREERRRTREVELSMPDLSGSHGSQHWKMRHLNPYVEGDEEGPFPSGASDKGEAEEEEEDDGSEHTHVSDDYNDPQTVTVPVTICLTIMVGYVFGGAILFAYYEKWKLLDGSYFCFISLSTIGFGDIVPGERTYGSAGQDGIINYSFVFCSMYLMLGMALIAMCFNLMQEEVIHKIRRTVRTIKRIFR